MAAPATYARSRMDMDLQAILAASDSSDEESPAVSSKVRYSLPSRHAHDVEAVDIEQLLQDQGEDDDDDDGSDDYDNLIVPRYNTSRRASSALSKYATFNSTGSDVTSNSHNPDDWAVLQAILQEDDDDNDDDEHDHELPAYHYRMDAWMDDSKNSDDDDDNLGLLDSKAMTVDAILQSSDHDESDDDNLLAVSRRQAQYGQEMLPSKSLSLASDTPAAVIKSPDRAAATTTAIASPEKSRVAAVNSALISQQELESKSSSPREEEKTAPSGTLIKQKRSSQTSGSLASLSAAESFEEESQRALAQAQAYERKLLKSGHREIVSPLSVKRRLRPKVELSARGSKVKRSGSGFGAERPFLMTNHQQLASRFNFSGVTENSRLTAISDNIVLHADKASKVVCGLPTALAVNSKFIAIGTQKGIILLYDLFEQLRQRLGHGYADDTFNLKKAGAITSLDLSFNGDLICAGYSSGILVLWDTIRGEPLKSISDAHPSPITSIRFMTDLKLVTVDAGGIVNKLTFTRNMIWLTYSFETECLLDGTAGQILAMSVLSPFSTVNPNVRAETLAPVLQKLTLIALSSERSSFAVAVEPSVNVLHRWARPAEDKVAALDKTRDDCRDETCLPCLAWGWALVSGGQNVVMPVLARAWGCCLQLLGTSFPTMDDDVAQSLEQVVHWPAFGVHEEIDTHAPVVALQWLDDRSLVFMTASKEFTLVDTVMLTLLERIDFSATKLVYAEFTLSRKTTSTEDDNATLMACTTFQNSIRSSDDRIVVLCCDEVRCVSIVGAKRRVASLEEDGEWLEALALALDHFESTIISQEDRRRGPLGRKDISHQFHGVRSDDEEWIAKLLVRYVNLAVDNAPVSSPEPVVKSFSLRNDSRSRNYLAQSHFQMLAGVVMEYCVTTRRLDLLFGPIFQRFQSAGFTSIFLDVLEPYILNDKLSYVAPETMSYFVQHCSALNDVATVERCLLHLDCTMMDFDNLLHLLRANGMFTALFYVYNQGLDDYTTPLEVLMDKLFDEADSSGAIGPRSTGNALETTFGKLGYKAFIYLQTCFKGFAFPLDKPLATEERQQSITIELMSLLARESFAPLARTKQQQVSQYLVGTRAERYPYARLLLLVDPKATLDTLAIGLRSTENLTVDVILAAESAEDQLVMERACQEDIPDKQDVINMLSDLVIYSDAATNQLVKRSPGLIPAFLDFAARYVMDKAVVVQKEIVMMIISRMVERFIAFENTARQQHIQKQMLDLFSALPRDSYQPDEALSLIDKADMHRVALLLHQQVASSWYEDNSKDIELRSYHFKRAIDCYLGDHEEAFRREVYDYVKKECAGLMKRTDAQSPLTLRDALFEKLPALVKLDSLLSARLVAELFVDDLDHVVLVLASEGGSKCLFRFFQVILSGDLLQFDPVAGSVLNLTNQHHEQYLALMAKLHPELVYDYLTTHDNYRPDECLKLCQKHDIADASAYLLERLGNVSSALQLILQTLESRMMNLKRSVRGMGVENFRRQVNRLSFSGRSPANISALPVSTKDEENVKRILVVALDLCERNSRTNSLRSELGSQLWFNVLDRLMNAKGFLRLEKEQSEHADIMGSVLSRLLHLTMQRMVSSVPLSDLVRKITSDSSGSRLGEMREMIESFIKTYGVELQVFEGATAVFREDLRNMRSSNRRLAHEGALVLSIGNTPLGSDEATGILQRLSHLDVVISTGNAGTAAIANVEGVSHSNRIESGLISALSRLRERRGRGHGPLADKRRAAQSGLNMMTTTELAYQQGECEPILFGLRPTGLLGEAEHKGRLVTFG